MTKLESDYTALRAHAERLAEKIEALKSFEHRPLCERVSEFVVWERTLSSAYEALTLYRAENPKV